MKSERSTGLPNEALRHRNNAARHLTVLSRDLEARMRTGLVKNQGFTSLRASLGPLFFLVWTRPAPVTSLARQLGVTKQACSQLANLAERAGYLERIQSPEDGRSKTLHLSPRGRALVERSIEIIRRADADYAAIVGSERYAQFTRTIAALYRALDFPADSGLSFLETATRTVGTLPLIAQRAQQALMLATAVHGHEGLKLSHSLILPFVGTSGIRISDLARIHDASPRAIAATARDLVSLGYLCKKPDPADRRGTLLFLSREGEDLVADSLVELESLERRIEGVLGRTVMSEFLETAAKIASALDPEEDIDDLFSSNTAPLPDHPPYRGNRDDEMQSLANRLHHELGDRRSIRLAELLSKRAAANSSRKMPT